MISNGPASARRHSAALFGGQSSPSPPHFTVDQQRITADARGRIRTAKSPLAYQTEMRGMTLSPENVPFFYNALRQNLGPYLQDPPVPSHPYLTLGLQTAAGFDSVVTLGGWPVLIHLGGPQAPRLLITWSEGMGELRLLDAHWSMSSYEQRTTAIEILRQAAIQSVLPARAHHWSSSPW